MLERMRLTAARTHVLVILLLLPATALGADEKIFALGLGSQISCGRFVAETEGRKVGSYAHFEKGNVTYLSADGVMMQYVYGVLTGLNAARDSDHQITVIDAAAIELWLRNWCTQNATSSLLDGVWAFANATPGTPVK
jgi:hypothetical protein